MDDNSWWLILIYLAPFALIALVIGLTLYAQKRRRDAMRDFAFRQGYEFSEKDEALRDNLIAAGFALFHQGHSRHLLNLMRTRLERSEVAVFDYKYTIGSGKSSHTYTQTALLFGKSDLHLPTFELRPEGFFDRLADALGRKDIDFPEHERFSRLYHLRGDDEQAIRALLTQDKLDYLAAHPGLSIEARGGAMLYYRAGKTVKVEELPTFIENGLELWRMFQPDTW